MVKFPAEIQRGGGGTHVELNWEKSACFSDLGNK